MVPYLSVRLAGCSVSPEISCGVRKLIRTPGLLKKKNKKNMHHEHHRTL
jgi:hypothetical protein